jgi:hypothetical protein
VPGEELNAFPGTLRQGGDAGEAIGFAECHRGRCCVGAATVGAGLQGRWVPLLRASGPHAIAVVAERQGDPWLV